MKNTFETKEYLAPEAEIISLLAIDVITSSGEQEEDEETVGPWVGID